MSATSEHKLQQLEEATTASHALFLQHKSQLDDATAALDAAKSKLRSLNPDAQRTLRVNDTELPELLSAKMFAQEEYDAAKKLYETNQKYFIMLMEKFSKDPIA